METITVQIPASTLKLSDAVSLNVADIHPQAWPGLINGVLRNLNSEASRAVINRIHDTLADRGEYVKDTKANRDAGKPPTTNADAQVLRAAWKESNPSLYDKWMEEAEQELVDSIKDGSFRVREAAGPRVASMSPEESRARDLARAEFDDVLLPKAGYDIPKNKAGNRHAPKGKQLAGLEIKTSQGVKLYPDALEAFFSKHRERFLAAAKRALESERKAAERNAGTVEGDTIEL